MKRKHLTNFLYEEYTMGKCGSIALDIKTYFAGKNQPTHPNVIAFDRPWHGYRYYMAYTPYPYANGCEENPCVAVSNDLIHWVSPRERVNPIATSEELACDELKDSHLLYCKVHDRLELWYLGRLDSTLAEGGQLHCLRKVSKDGCSWSNYEVMYSFTEFNLVSESVLYDGAYRFWGIRHTAEDIGLYYMQSPDGLHWTELVKCEVPQAALTDMWHGTVIFQEGKYHFVWVGNSGIHRQRVYYADSSDGIHFSQPHIILENDTGWEYLYRPCPLKAEGQWYCYYGVIRSDGKWLISMSKGPVIQKLRGITADELGTISQAADALISSGRKLRIKKLVGDAEKLFTPRLLLLAPLLILLRLLQFSPLAVWGLAVVFGTACSFVRISRKKAVQRGLLMGTISAAAASFAAEILTQLLQMIGNLL